MNRFGPVRGEIIYVVDKRISDLLMRLRIDRYSPDNGRDYTADVPRRDLEDKKTRHTNVIKPVHESGLEAGREAGRTGTPTKSQTIGG